MAGGRSIKHSNIKNPMGASTNLGHDPFEALRTLLNCYRYPDADAETSIPFKGGAVGFFSYELGSCIETLPPPRPPDLGFPGMLFRFFNIIYAFDHNTRQGHLLVGELPDDPDRRGPDYVKAVREAYNLRLSGISDDAGRQSFLPPADNRAGMPGISVPPRCDTTHEEYLAMVRKGREYIAAGDIFQVNLSQRFSWPVSESPQDLYRRLRDHHPAPYAAYVQVDPAHAVLSVSPELYLSIRGKDIETRPIKGTGPRYQDPAEDDRARRKLLQSEKDRAELVMIVDLMRNDLGRVCEFGTVTVPRLYDLESFATVHHLVARVLGVMRDGLDLVDGLRASFPGGSVTGAPKIRAMEIIAELEKTARSVYTGSVGWIGLDGSAELNIAIRTVLTSDHRAVYRVGGAVVADSDPQAEYEETLHKGRALYEILSRSTGLGYGHTASEGTHQ